MKVAKDDNFEEIMKIKDHGDDVTLMIQSDGTKDDNRYLLLVDDDDEVVAMELVGYINPQFVLTTYDRSYN
jgi:hypothetical protein